VFEVVYYVLSSEYNDYMDIQQAVNLEIYSRFAKEGISFAYPTRTLYMTQEAPRGS
jgi:small-conductance mechanosensitive channel